MNFTRDFAFDQSPKTLCEPERLPKKRTFANQNAKLKQLPKRRNFMLTKMLAEKERLVFLTELLPGKDKPILKTYKANHEHCQ